MGGQSTIAQFELRCTPGHIVSGLIFGLALVYSLGTMTCKTVQIMALQQRCTQSGQFAVKCSKLTLNTKKTHNLYKFKRVQAG
jgi:hypothetical protein